MRAWVVDALWLVLCGSLSALWCISSGRELGATIDEPFYLEKGVAAWRTGSNGELLQLGTMPLPARATSAPVWVWERWRDRPVDWHQELPQALALGRPVTLLFWWLLLVYGLLFARRIGGIWAGRIAVAFLACEPCLLANAGLATTDIALAACLLVFVYHYQVGRERGWLLRVGLPGVLFGIALLAKVSTLVFGLLIVIVLEALRAAERSAGESPWGTRMRAIGRALWTRDFRNETCQIVGIGIILGLLACGSDWQPDEKFSKVAHGLPEGHLASGMVWLSDHLRVFPNALTAIVFQFRHNIKGHGAYLLGTTSPRALWYFFPVVLTMKLTESILLLPGVLALVSFRSLANRLMAIAGVLLLFSFTYHVQIGTRLVLPLVVFFILGLSVAVVDAWKAATGQWRRPFLVTACAIVLWSAIAVARVWPNGIQYVNEFWGGTRTGYLCLGGSDYDWGQGVPQLARWANGRKLVLVYYGTDALAESPQFETLNWDTTRDRPVTVEEITAVLHGRDLAVSISLLYGPPVWSEEEQELLRVLRTCPPVARTDCFFIYRFPVTQLDRPGVGKKVQRTSQ
jgi:4-amino-4-deoxy-L-arabinose transferase-like glycosyltransferase